MTTRMRGIPVEVPLGTSEGLRKACVANVDSVTTIAKSGLESRAGTLSAAKVAALDRSLRFALGLSR